LRVHDGAETPSTISLKQASTIAEIRTDSNEPGNTYDLDGEFCNHCGATLWVNTSNAKISNEQ
jgi:hypothetical protein